MKISLLIALIALILVSCEKDSKFPENPDWLNARISQMESPPYYAGTVVSGYEWNREYYYWISIPLSSCWMCEFYTYEGDRYVWTDKKYTDFQKNGKKVKTVWQRPFQK